MLIMDLPPELWQFFIDHINDIMALCFIMIIIAVLLFLFPSKPWHSGGIKPRM